MKEKILADLDVLTVGFWDKNKEAVSFIERAEKGEFEIYTPFAILETLSLWKNEKLKSRIKEFYELHSSRIISASEYLERSGHLGIDGKKIADELAEAGIRKRTLFLSSYPACLNWTQL